jgi:FdhD protein
MSGLTTPFDVVRYDAGAAETRPDDIATEEPLELRVEGITVAVVMRTPGHDRELAAGFLVSEGIIKSAKDLFDITTCVTPGTAGKGNVVDAALAQPGSFDPSKLTRHLFTSASCGVCSKASIEVVLRRRKPLPSSHRIPAETIFRLPRRLSQHQDAFRRSGGMHACALFNSAGELLGLREDVGRHNALDKLIGWALLEKLLPLDNHILLLSGRTSFEMMQKAHGASIPIVVAISAPTSLAVEFAQESGQTLAGFVRGRTMNLYAHPERIVLTTKRAGRITPARPD